MKEDNRHMEQRAGIVDVEVERKLRRIFLASAVLCLLIVLELWALLRHGEGLRLLLRVSFLPLLLWSLAVTGYAFHALWGIAQLRKASLQEMAIRDTITGAFTETYLLARMEQERERAMETGQAAAVAHARLCGIEAINETYGHTVGNVVLKDLVRIMMSNVPEGAIVGRLGGLEFMIFIPQTSMQAAETILRNLRQIITQYRLDLGERGTIGGLDVRIGIAAYPCDGDSPGDLTRIARRKPLGIA